MKKLIPLKKDIPFKTNISEVTSISLEHTLHTTKDNFIEGDLIISGEYKIAATSINTESFSFNIPLDIDIESHYDTTHVLVDINDFYYEVFNNKSLIVNIEICIDKLQEKPVMEKLEENKEVLKDEEKQEEQQKTEEEIEENLESERCKMKEDYFEEKLNENEVIPVPVVTEEKVQMVSKEENETSLFGNFKEEAESYGAYYVYIVREGDTLEDIISKYKTTKEELELLNNLNDLKIGDKLIIKETNEKD